MSNTLFPIGRRIGLDRELDSIINSFFGPAQSAVRSNRISTVATTPRANVIKEEEGFTIELAAPGFSRDEFEISVDNNVLTVQVGTTDTVEYTQSLTSQEYSYSSFTRSWSLPKEVAQDAIQARYNAGILYVTVPTTGSANNKIVIDVE